MTDAQKAAVEIVEKLNLGLELTSTNEMTDLVLRIAAIIDKHMC